MGLFIFGHSALAGPNQCLDLYAKISTAKSENPYRKFKSELPGEPRISLSRFYGFDSFSERYSSNYYKSANAFSIQENPIHSHQAGSGKSENFLEELQNFPLGKMQETGYIRATNAKMFNELGASLDTGQVNFFEVTREASRKDWAQYPAELLNVRWDNLNTFSESQSSDMGSLRTATLWSVGGQTLNRENYNGQKSQLNFKLPWEKEDARKDQTLDRTKYKYVWEWGRAAQDIANEITPAYSGNAALNYIDLVTSDGNLKDAYVMFHSFDRINTRYYLKEHPGSTYPPSEKNENDMLFIVPLTDMIQRYPPSKFSARSEKIIHLSGSKISETQALDLLIDLRLLRWDELNSTGKIRQKGPVILNDPSNGFLIGLQIRLLSYGLTKEQIIAMMDYLVPIQPTLHTPNIQNKYENAADSILTSFEYKRLNAVEISNLDPQQARRDPNYVKQTVFHSYMVYVNRLANLISATYKISPLEAKKEAIQILLHHGVSFGVTSAFAEVQRQSEKLNPSSKASQVKTEMKFEDKDLKVSHPYFFRDNKIYIFTLPQIMEWAKKAGRSFLNGDYELNPGYWRQQYFRSQVDIL